jgi:hypothetical protein
MTAMVTKIPHAKTNESMIPLEPLFSCRATRNPMMRGMLERWHGLSKMLNTPQAKEARSAAPRFPYMASVSDVNNASMS